MSVRYDVALRKIVATLTRRDVLDISPDRWPTDYGLDSLSLLIFREQCERAFGLTIPDDEWDGFRALTDILDFVRNRTRRVAGETTQGAETLAGNHPWDASDTVEDLTIGMPMTGINQLSESALLKHLGDLRWRHITKLTGVSSKNLVDCNGERLYPAFFFVDVQFPALTSMAAYGENDKVELIDTVARFGSSLLDGIAYIVPYDRRNSLQQPLRGMADALAHGVPAVRLSNVFVMQFNGAEWLKKGRPREELLRAIPVTETPPDSYSLNKQAEASGHLAVPGPTYVSLHRDVIDYNVNPDRDVNGVGLLYFANYPVFLDLAERTGLKSAPLPLDDALINRRSVVRRRIAYLNNASWRDSMKIESEIWISNPFLEDEVDLSISPIRIFSNQIAYRRSDGRAMCVSSCEKVLYGIVAEEIPWIAQLRPSTA